MRNTQKNDDVTITTFAQICTALTLLFVHLNCAAASFNCAKASGYAETAICHNAELSSLDDELGEIYTRQKHAISSAQSQQKRWLTETRNKCGSIECLKLAYQERLSVLRQSGSCPLSETNLIGHWIREKQGFFEEMEFSKSNGERQFSSWIHHRPEMFGKWAISECVIRIDGDTAINFSFTPIKVENNRIFMIDDDKVRVTYRKAK